MIAGEMRVDKMTADKMIVIEMTGHKKQTKWL
jgi:hypothetical protein